MTKKLKLMIIIALVISGLWAGYTPNIPIEVLLQKYGSDESKFVSNKEGLRVHYTDQGLKGQKVIVLLHGNSNSLHIFEPLVSELIPEYRVISLDFPGHGLTGGHPRNKYGYQALGEALELVVKHLSLNDYTLLGHSMGGWVAWRYAVDHPTELNALILMSASGMPPRQNDPEPNTGIGFKLLASPIGPLLSAYTLPRSIVAKSIKQSIFKKQFATDKRVDTFWELLRHPENRKALAYRARSDREEDKADLANTIKIPTLLIWGEHDGFVNPSASISFKERIENTQTLLLPNVGHMPMIEATEDAASAMREFLAGK